MAAQDQNDLIPRPSPKPTPIEIVSVQPEVPEASLLFDQCSNNSRDKTRNLSEYSKQSVDRNIDKGYLFKYKNDDMHRKLVESNETLNRSQILPTCYSSLFQKQAESHHTPKKVSFLTHFDKYCCNKSPNQAHNLADCNKRSYRSEPISCCSHEAESNLVNDCKYSSALYCSDYFCKTPRFEHECDHLFENGIYNVKRCMCSNCNKQCHSRNNTNHLPEEQKSNSISPDELQKIILKFENLFLKLNYKYSKITESFVLKEELNLIMQKYDAQINSMQKRIDELSQKQEPVLKNIENQQLKLMYNNIVSEVKNMLQQKNSTLNMDKNVDSVQFIKKVTLDQFHKMGLNIENINEEEKKTMCQNEETISVPTVNAPSKDLSLHMNTLTMKYTPENQVNSHESEEKKSVNDISINYNNISVATLQYLERYQLLSAIDRDGFNNHENIPLDRRNKVYEKFQNNDKSFIY